jgi:hypothetical protein
MTELLIPFDGVMKILHKFYESDCEAFGEAIEEVQALQLKDGWRSGYDTPSDGRLVILVKSWRHSPPEPVWAKYLNGQWCDETGNPFDAYCSSFIAWSENPLLTPSDRHGELTSESAENVT